MFIEPMHRNKPNITYLLTCHVCSWKFAQLLFSFHLTGEWSNIADHDTQGKVAIDVMKTTVKVGEGINTDIRFMLSAPFLIIIA